DLEVFRQVMYIRDSFHRLRVTPSGIPYRLCDVVWNFALFRREMLEVHRWDERLKVGEHSPYFFEVKRAAQWRVACCPSVIVNHDTGGRSEHYQSFRGRSRQFFDEYLRRNGLSDYRRDSPWRFEDELESRPCIVVLGVGHSGTSILTK